MFLLFALLACHPNTDAQADTGSEDTGPFDVDGDGVPASLDCDDNDPTARPASEEVCDEVDNDCDGDVDEGMVLTTFYPDLDGDGYGGPVYDEEGPTNAVEACVAPEGYVEDRNDCNDADAEVQPGATEVCDGIDNNCDSGADEGVTWYPDSDGDGYGEEGTGTCEGRDGYVQVADDCDDSDARVYRSAPEDPADGVDNDCDGIVDVDETDGDGDGFKFENECDDTNPDVCPACEESCDDSVDNDCDGEIDEGC